MGTEPIPDYEDMTARKVELELLEEGYAFSAADVLAWVQSEEEARFAAPGGCGDAADRGDFLVRPRFRLQNRRFSAWGPSSPYYGGELKRRFVGENDDGVQLAGFFLMSGNSFLTQWRMRLSSRSIACFSGRCGLQPRRPRRRPM